MQILRAEDVEVIRFRDRVVSKEPLETNEVQHSLLGGMSMMMMRMRMRMRMRMKETKKKFAI